MEQCVMSPHNRLRSWLSNHPRTSARRPDTRLAVEPLEQRVVPSGFTFADFTNTGGLNLIGAATVTNSNRLRLTPAQGSTGAAWYVADKAFVAGDFETTFQFQLATATGGADGSDGFAFVIQNSSPTELRGGGGALGYSGMPNSVAVEFDTFLNTENGDPSQSHISVHTNGTGSNGVNESYSLGVYNTSGFILDDAQVHTGKLSYAPGTLSVYLDNLTTPVITVSLDLAGRLDPEAGSRRRSTLRSMKRHPTSPRL
jgi:hypothetical protein